MTGLDHWFGLAARLDGDLMVSELHGFAYQLDRSHIVTYDGAYFDKCRSYEGEEIARAINAGRIAMVDRHAGAEIGVLDIGVGSGEFVRLRPNTFGYDINPRAVEWLKEHHRWSGEIEAFEAFTFWDVIEHLPDPAVYLDRVPPGAHLFCSLPIFADITRVRESRHYRPGEHLQYWTCRGFRSWMRLHGFEHLETSDHETIAGREAILSFAFRRSDTFGFGGAP